MSGGTIDHLDRIIITCKKLIISSKNTFKSSVLNFHFFFLTAGVDEEGAYIPHSPDEEESEESDEDDSDEQVSFSEVTEVRFPGEVGPLGDRRLCKIRCVKGKWVGPLCATNEEGNYTLAFIMPEIMTT